MFFVIFNVITILYMLQNRKSRFFGEFFKVNFKFNWKTKARTVRFLVRVTGIEKDTTVVVSYKTGICFALQGLRWRRRGNVAHTACGILPSEQITSTSLSYNSIRTKYNASGNTQRHSSPGEIPSTSHQNRKRHHNRGVL